MTDANPQTFEQSVRSYSAQLSSLLTENPWAFWSRDFWTYGHWARRDPELQKVLARLYGLLDEVRRCAGADGIADAKQTRIQEVLRLAPETLTLSAALEVFALLDRIVIEIGDAGYISEQIERELLWVKGSTTWLTWDKMYGTATPKVVEKQNLGETVPEAPLSAARHQLLAYRAARSNDYQVHRARQKMRAKNLCILAILLAPLVATFGWLLAAHPVCGTSAWEIWLMMIVGALGSLVSGTIRARDKLVRGSDLRAFKAGIAAQIFIGMASSLFLCLLLTSSILSIAGSETFVGRAVYGFVAGFSEPFFLKTVERVATMGEEAAKEPRRG